MHYRKLYNGIVGNIFNDFFIKILFTCRFIIQFVDCPFCNLLFIKHEGGSELMYLFKCIQTRLLMRQGIRRQWRQQDQQAVTEHHPEMSCSNAYWVDAAGCKENEGMKGDAPSAPSNLFSQRRRRTSLKCTSGNGPSVVLIEPSRLHDVWLHVADCP